MSVGESSWRTAAFRQSVVVKIDEAIQRSGMPTSKNSMEMENHVFQKAKTKEEYLGFVARLILHVREMNSKKAAGMGGPNPAMQDPINALQTLARQGTGNTQMMGMGGPQGVGMVQQPQSQVAAATLLQSLNQRPVQGLAGLQKMPDMGGMGPGPQVGSMGPMQNQMRVQMAGQLPGQMQQMQGQMQGQLQGQMQQMQGQMQPQMQPQMQGQMQPQMQGSMPGQMPPQMQPQMQGQMQAQMQGQMQGQMQPQMQAQMQAQMQGQMQPQMQGQMPPQMQVQMAGQMPHGMAQQIQRKLPNAGLQGQDVLMMPGHPPGFGGPRNVTPSQFLRQSPSPSAQSPAPHGSQMAASPAMVPSPSPQHTPMPVPQRSVGMAPSPSSSLNTPGQVAPTPSPCSMQEDQAYREKVRQLSKYIEPLRRMIAKMGNDDVEKLSKMKKLLDILSNPSQRMPLETLLKCEVVLEKLDLKRGEPTSVGSVPPPLPHMATLKEHHIFNCLLEAVNQHMYSPVVNHTLQRTFGPCLESLFGPEIKMMPPPLKKKKVEEIPNDIPDVLQGEIARLDQRFKVSLDPTQQPGSRSVQLVCWLDDRHLPCVPPVSLTVPEDYPSSPPRCHMAQHEYGATAFLLAVQRALEARISKLPGRFSVSQLLDTWEMSVRQASAPTVSPVPTVAAAALLMGL